MPQVGKKTVAVVGATGAVGRTIAKVLAERGYPVGDYHPVATARSGGRDVEALGKRWPVAPSEAFDFAGVDVCFFTAGAAVSRELVPRALDQGCRVVDNTTAFRMQDGVPLVVPEINGGLVTRDSRLVSCPNCTTIVLVMTLAPILEAVPIERVVVTSFQSVSGAGRRALEELDQPGEAVVFPKIIAGNCIPQIGDVQETGSTSEETKIVEEARKILGAPGLRVSATAVRVPVRVGHSISVNVELGAGLDLTEARRLWEAFPGVTYDPGLPTPRDAAGIDSVVVGRARRDATRPHAISYWAVGDNLRKGAATNSVQIAELLT